MEGVVKRLRKSPNLNLDGNYYHQLDVMEEDQEIFLTVKLPIRVYAGDRIRYVRPEEPSRNMYACKNEFGHVVGFSMTGPYGLRKHMPDVPMLWQQLDELLTRPNLWAYASVKRDLEVFPDTHVTLYNHLVQYNESRRGLPPVNKQRVALTTAAERVHQWFFSHGIRVSIKPDGFGEFLNYMKKHHILPADVYIPSMISDPADFCIPDPVDLIRDDPISAVHISGITFRTLIRYMDPLPIPEEYKQRAQVYQAFQTALENRHTCLLDGEALEKIHRSLPHLSTDTIRGHVKTFVDMGEFVLAPASIAPGDRMNYLYDSDDFRAESNIVSFLTRLMKPRAEEKIDVDQEQQAAIQMMQDHSFSILTGGPGVGKTYCITQMLKQFFGDDCDPGFVAMNQLLALGDAGPSAVARIIQEANLELPCNQRVFLLAPTGKAAQVLQNNVNKHICGMFQKNIEASTIHRFIASMKWKSSRNDDYNFKDNNFKDNFKKSDTMVTLKESLPIRVIVVDECSMLDLRLFASLLEYVPPRCKLILVGDPNQLPSVGAGHVLHDLLECKLFPHVHLSKNRRSDEEAKELRFAIHHFMDAREPFLEGPSFRCLPPVTKEQLVATLHKNLSRWVDLPQDVLVLTPTNKMKAEYTRSIREAYLRHHKVVPEYRTLKNGDEIPVLVHCDRVVCLKNQEDGIVRNGTIGTILGITYVEHDHKKVKEYHILWDDDLQGTISDARTELVNLTKKYSAEFRDQLDLGYVMTVHKAQGSQAKLVLVLLADANYEGSIQTRNLVYTAISRAKKRCLVFGSTTSIQLARTREEMERCTRLKDRLLGVEPDERLAKRFKKAGLNPAAV
jgi:exodeoxyribonuclease V alpha subunit